MVVMGATASRLPMRTPAHAIRKVRSSARLGSSRCVTLKKLRNGMTPSRANACSNRGALDHK
jgi:hypothetical protein